MRRGESRAKNPHFHAAEYEFYQFRAPKGPGASHDDHNSSATARFLKDNAPHALPHLTEGMMGYSLTDPQRNQEWYYDIFNTCDKFRCGIEGWHTESGPGVFEAVRQRSLDQRARFPLNFLCNRRCHMGRLGRWRTRPPFSSKARLCCRAGGRTSRATGGRRIAARDG